MIARIKACGNEALNCELDFLKIGSGLEGARFGSDRFKEMKMGRATLNKS